MNEQKTASIWTSFSFRELCPMNFNKKGLYHEKKR
jgi:hypothetical protein